jgi:hypothetical protein
VSPLIDSLPSASPSQCVLLSSLQRVEYSCSAYCQLAPSQTNDSYLKSSNLRTERIHCFLLLRCLKLSLCFALIMQLFGLSEVLRESSNCFLIRITTQQRQRQRQRRAKTARASPQEILFLSSTADCESGVTPLLDFHSP